MVGHDEFIELLGAYALDAVDDDERRAVEAHLVMCPTCQAEVLEHIEVAAALGAQYTASMPADLWGRIEMQIEAGPTEVSGEPLRLPPLAVFDTAGPDRDDRARPANAHTTSAHTTSTPTAEPAEPDDIDPSGDPAPPDTLPGAAGAGGRVVSLDAQRRPRRSGRLATALVAAAAAIVMVLLGSGLLRADQRTNDAEQLAATSASILALPPLERAADLALANPANPRYVLTSETSGAKATAVVTGTGDGFLVPDGMAVLPPDRAYQLWVIGPGGPVSLGVMGSEPRTTAFHVDGSVPMLAITNEVSGGVPSPQTKPLLTATI